MQFPYGTVVWTSDYPMYDYWMIDCLMSDCMMSDCMMSDCMMSDCMMSACLMFDCLMSDCLMSDCLKSPNTFVSTCSSFFIFYVLIQMARVMMFMNGAISVLNHGKFLIYLKPFQIYKYTENTISMLEHFTTQKYNPMYNTIF